MLIKKIQMINPTDFNNLIHNRRSIFPKDYITERVDDEIIKQMLENANWAPTHKLTEPWRFVVFTGDGLKKLAVFQGECYKEVTGKAGSFKEDRYQNLRTKPLESSHIIAVGMKRDEMQRVPEWEELAAVFCAIQNMYLTATVYGVGCYISTGGITNFEEAKEFFGLGPQDKLCGFLNVGMTKPGLKFGMKRNPIEEKVKWVQ
jgi:nitroreductase